MCSWRALNDRAKAAYRESRSKYLNYINVAKVSSALDKLFQSLIGQHLHQSCTKSSRVYSHFDFSRIRFTTYMRKTEMNNVLVDKMVLLKIVVES